MADADVHERLAASEEALQLYRKRLREIVSRRTRELSKINRDLSEEVARHEKTEAALREAVERLETHSRAQTDFVSNVSHELKTPLASIGYAVTNLLSGVAGAVPERIESYLTLIKEDTERLGATITDILDMSRIEARTSAILIMPDLGQLQHR